MTHASGPDNIYLDHADATLIAKSLVDRVAHDLTSNLYGNPNSTSPLAQFTSNRIEAILANVLRFFNGDPAYYDLVFVANAAAGVRAVVNVFRDLPSGFWYDYHSLSDPCFESARELATQGYRCFTDDEDLEQWLEGYDLYVSTSPAEPELFAYPAQSNMGGRRLPLDWAQKVQHPEYYSDRRARYCLLDATAYAATTQLDLRVPDAAPGFLVLSFEKIFGFPNLGCVITKRASAKRLFISRNSDTPTAMVKDKIVNPDTIEDIRTTLGEGSLPVQSILALGHAMSVHNELFGSMKQISHYTKGLTKYLFAKLDKLHHSNGRKVCGFYYRARSDYINAKVQGSVIEFVLRTPSQAVVSCQDVAKLAAEHKIHLRVGEHCADRLARPQRSSPSAASGRHETAEHSPLEVLVVSIGAMSLPEDVDGFVSFIKKFFVDVSGKAPKSRPNHNSAQLRVLSTGSCPTTETQCHLASSLAVFRSSWKDSSSVPGLLRWDHDRGLVVAGT